MLSYFYRRRKLQRRNQHGPQAYEPVPEKEWSKGGAVCRLYVVKTVFGYSRPYFEFGTYQKQRRGFVFDTAVPAQSVRDLLSALEAATRYCSEKYPNAIS